MNWFRKPLMLALVAACGFAALGAKKDDEAKPAAAKAERKKDDKKGDKKEDKKGKAEPAPDKGSGRISVPVPPGHDAKGLVIPYRDQKGGLQMRFTMELGQRVDEDHMAMKKLLIETFDEAGNGEMTIDLPQSILNLGSRVITTESGVVVKRADFELSGQTMEFNTETRAGHIGGKVRMLIYNLENETNSTPEAAPSEK